VRHHGGAKDPAGQARVERRLAAILAADLAGYSRLIDADEGGTLERLRALRRELIDPKIAEHRANSGCRACAWQRARGYEPDPPPDGAVIPYDRNSVSLSVTIV